MSYDLNDAIENVQNFTIGYNAGDIPVNLGSYASNKLLKNSYTDENGKNVIEYYNNLGWLLLKKYSWMTAHPLRIPDGYAHTAYMMITDCSGIVCNPKP